jgi:VWFA-related protein
MIMRSAVLAVTLAIQLATPVISSQTLDPQRSDVLATEPVRSSPAQSPNQQSTFRGDVNFVSVDVLVLDRDGSFVSDLAAGDFEVRENGRRQEIQTFKIVDFRSRPPSAIDPPSRPQTNDDWEVDAGRDDVRLFALFLDEYHVRRENAIRSRSELATFVRGYFESSDLLQVMSPLMTAASARLTTNHGDVAASIEEFEGRKFDYDPRHTVEYPYACEPVEVVERIRNEVSLSAIQALIERLGALKQGRKTLILVTEGYTNYMPPELRSRSACALDISGGAAKPWGAQSLPIEERAAQRASNELEVNLRDVYSAANRNNVSIYTVDPRGLAVSEFPSDRNVAPRSDRLYLDAATQSLRTLALETDGSAALNRNRLTDGMRAIVNDSSSHYLLGYTSTESSTDGKFHAINVRVRRPGVRVRARRGFWPVRPAEPSRSVTQPTPALAPALAEAFATLARPSSTQVIHTWVGVDRQSDGQPMVTFVWEPVAGQVQSASRPANVSLTAIGDDGATAFRGPVRSTSNASAQVTFVAPPGRMHLRILIEGPDSNVLDSETRDIAVPTMSPSRLFVGTPRIFVAQSAQALEAFKSGTPIAPTAQRQFRRQDRLLVRMSFHPVTGREPAFSARLMDRRGDPLSETMVSVRGRDAMVELSLANLAIGDYLVGVTAFDEENVEQFIAFRVVR